MTAIHETAYPRLKSTYSDGELIRLFTPHFSEIDFVRKKSKDIHQHLCLLVLLKTFQNVGYFVLLKQVPTSIVAHIGGFLGCLFAPTIPAEYDRSGNRPRHQTQVRDFLAIQSVTERTYQRMEEMALKTAQTKEHLADIINVMIEELIQARWELPGFTRFDETAAWARTQVNEAFFQGIAASLETGQKQRMDENLSTTLPNGVSWWQFLKQEPVKPTTYNIALYLNYLDWLKQQQSLLPANPVTLPAAKRRQFCYEAHSTHLTQLQRLKESRRYTFVSLLLAQVSAKALDNLVNLLLKMQQKLDNQAQRVLEQYRQKQQHLTDALVEQLARIVVAYQTEGTEAQRLQAIGSTIPGDAQSLLQACHQHLAYASDNYLLCLLPFYYARRALLLRCLSHLRFQSASQDNTIIQAVEWILSHWALRKEWVSAQDAPLDWITDKWRRLVTGKSVRISPQLIHRKYYELCVIYQLCRELKSGDIYVADSDEYDDYRRQLIDWQQYEAQIDQYTTVSGIPSDSDALVNLLKESLIRQCRQTDQRFPANTLVDIEKGELVIRRSTRQEIPLSYHYLDEQLKRRMEAVGILEVLISTEKWLSLSGLFHTLAGNESRVEKYSERFVTTLFCYGCNVGPMQTARSISGVSRKQVAWLNLHHITEERLDEAIVQVVNTYNRFLLPRCWGSGQHASVDGTKWNVYEQNLLAEWWVWRHRLLSRIGHLHCLI